MLIDFHQYIPEDKREQIQQVTMHIPPRLSNIPTSPFNSRDKFVQWIQLLYFAKIDIVNTFMVLLFIIPIMLMNNISNGKTWPG